MEGKTSRKNETQKVRARTVEKERKKNGASVKMELSLARNLSVGIKDLELKWSYLGLWRTEVIRELKGVLGREGGRWGGGRIMRGRIRMKGRKEGRVETWKGRRARKREH